MVVQQAGEPFAGACRVAGEDNLLLFFLELGDMFGDGLIDI